MTVRYSPLLVALLALTLGAQTKDQTSHWGSHLGPQPPSPPPRSLDWDEQHQLASQHAGWQTWKGEHPGWRALFDPRSGQPQYAYGPPMQVLPDNPTKHEVAAISGSVAEKVTRALGLEMSAYTLSHVQRAGSLWYVHFQQKFSGAWIQNAALTLRIDIFGRLVMWGVRYVDTSTLTPGHVLDAGQAQAAATQYLTELGYVGPQTTTQLEGVEAVVHVKETRVDLQPTLTWLVKIRAENLRADWMVFVDSQTGQVVDYWNAIRECGCTSGPEHTCAGPEHTCSDHTEPLIVAPTPVQALLLLADINGVARGTTHEGLTPQQVPQMTNFPELQLVINGQLVTTDATGAYTFSGGPATVPVTSAFNSTWVAGTSQTTANASFSGNATTGTFDVVFTNTNSTIGERDAVYFGRKTHAFLKQYWPSNTAMDIQINAVVNRNDGSCNASYSNFGTPTMNFFNASGNCINTATSSTVVEHEYGHGISIRSYPPGFGVPGHLGEGYSDAISALMENTPQVGQGFSGPGTFVRNLANNCQYPTSCGTQIHARGRLIGGCIWDLKNEFESNLGATGTTLVRQHALRHLAGGPQDEIDSLMEILLQDDNDGNLANGTPNVALIREAFTVRHGVPFPIELVSIGHVPPGDSLDQLSGYQIHATASSITGNAIVTMQLWWRVGNGGPAAIAMLPTGPNSYSATIPPQPAGSRIQYWIRATDSQNQVGLSPQGAPTTTHGFNTALLDSFYSDDFETPSGWVHVQLAQQDDWQNIQHGNTAHPYDPPTAFSGTLTWGNDLVPASNWNGNYQNNVNNYLQSPPIDCTGRTGVTLSYHRWLTVEDGFYDQAQIFVSANGGPFIQVWQNPVGSGTDHFIDSAWTQHDVDISSVADGQPNVRIRFELTSDGGLVFGGWNIDALNLQTQTTTPILTDSGSNQSGQLYNIHMNGSPGDFVVLAASANQAASYVEGIGTFSIDLSGPLVLFYPASSGFGTGIPALGQATLSVVVPSSPGLTLYIQALLLRGASPSAPVISNVLTPTIN